METRGSFHARYGPWAVVAGASEGLGAEFASQLAAKGLNLILVARREAQLRALSQQLSATHGIEAVALRGDLGDGDFVSELEVATAGKEVGLLVYNAALGLIGPFLDSTAEEHERELDLNCRGPLRLTHYFGGRMAAAGRGGVILMSSLAGLQGSALVSNYAATKAYNLVLGEGLWEELRHKGVDVLACCAGATLTPNYVASKPKSLGFFSVPVQEPKDVVAEALNALGKRPSLLTGRVNRLASFFMGRVMTRKWTVRTMGKNMRALYNKDGD